MLVSAAAQAAGEAESGTVLRHDLDEITTRVLRNKIIWSGDYTAMVDNFIDDDGDAKTKDSTFGVFRHRVRLGLQAHPNEYFAFHGRLAAFRGFEDYNGTGFPPQAEPSAALLRPNLNSVLGVERMYMDFYPPAKWISASFGLIPSTGGRPSHLKRIESVKSTYPNTLFDYTFPAAVLAVHPAEVFSALPEAHIWFIYSKFSEQGLISAGGNTYLDPTKFNIKNSADVFIAMAEARANVSWAEKLTTSLSYGLIKNYKIGFDDPGTLAAIRGSALNGFDLDPSVPIGNISRAVLYLEAEHVFHTAFTPFISGSVSLMTPGTVSVPVTGTAGTVGGEVGLTGSVHTEDRYGMAVYTGFNYEFADKISAFLGAPTLGYEFYVPQRGYFGGYTNGDDILGRLANGGPSHQFYATLPITDATRLHVAYTHMITNTMNNVFETRVPQTGATTSAVVARHRILDAIQLSWMLVF